MNIKNTLIALASPALLSAQVMTPETLWSLKRLSVQTIAPDQSALIYKVGTVDIHTEKNSSISYFLNLKNQQSTKINFGKKSLIQWDKNGIYAQEGEKIYLSRESSLSLKVKCICIIEFADVTSHSANGLTTIYSTAFPSETY